MGDLDSNMTELQENTTSLSDARLLFDASVHRNPSIKAIIGPKAQILENLSFEYSVFKIHFGKQDDLNAKAKRFVSHLKLNAEDTSIPAHCDSFLLFSKSVLKNRLLNANIPRSAFMDLAFILRTSNIFENLFQFLDTHRKTAAVRFFPQTWSVSSSLTSGRVSGACKNLTT